MVVPVLPILATFRPTFNLLLGLRRRDFPKIAFVALAVQRGLPQMDGTCILLLSPRILAEGAESLTEPEIFVHPLLPLEESSTKRWSPSETTAFPFEYFSFVQYRPLQLSKWVNPIRSREIRSKHQDLRVCPTLTSRCQSHFKKGSHQQGRIPGNCL